jgi:hypothetical protein
LKGLRELAAEGYLPRNRLSEQERLLAQLSGAISEDLGNLGRAQQSIGETQDAHGGAPAGVPQGSRERAGGRAEGNQLAGEPP